MLKSTSKENMYVALKFTIDGKQLVEKSMRCDTIDAFFFGS